MTLTLDSDDFQHAKAEFKRIWGYNDFRSPQGEIIQTLLTGRDALVVMPTGGGKSICFQLPALLQGGLTLVISPLVALMENQVAELRQKQLAAATLHSQIPKSQRQQTLQALAQGRLNLLYLSPETLFSESVWDRLLQPEITVRGLILDEAHCLVQWGDTFRPAYRRLGSVRPVLQQHQVEPLAIAAFTATADRATQDTLCRALQLRNPQKFLLNPYRPNLTLRVQCTWSPRQRWETVHHYILKQALQQTQPAHTKQAQTQPAQTQTVGHLNLAQGDRALAGSDRPQPDRTGSRYARSDRPQLDRPQPDRPNPQHTPPHQRTPSGLVYVRTRKDSEQLAQRLQRLGHKTCAYHGGLTAGERREIEAQWMADELPFVVSTNAFGMGVNKPNVRWVVHYQVPLLLAEYIQEVGRAGRDGQGAEALALVSEPTGWLDPSDRQRWQFFQSQQQKQYQAALKLAPKIPQQGRLETVIQQFPQAEIALGVLHSLDRLQWSDPFTYRLLQPPSGSPQSAAKTPPATWNPSQAMAHYLHSPQCRWTHLLQAFGFRPDRPRCGHCDNCLGQGHPRLPLLFQTNR
ncbi:MAG: RecQ family ATP-dependent DNA helicase [Prochlorothrix sp.]